MNSRGKTLGLVVVFLLFAALLFREGALAWLSIPFLCCLGLGLILAPAEDGAEAGPTASRRCEELEGGEEALIEVSVVFRNPGRAKIHLKAHDLLPSRARLVEGSLEARASLRPGDEAELRYVFAARRGDFRWDKLDAKLVDPFDLFEVDAPLDAPARLKVHPRVRRIPPLALRLRDTLSSPGSIPIRLGGSGTDFWGIREYRPGDPPKNLYWRLSARDPLRRYTKEFIQERTAEVILVLDGRRRMELAEGSRSLFDIEVETAAELAAMLIREGHRVGLSIVGVSSRKVLPDYGRIQLRRILDALAEADPEGELKRDAALHLPPLRYARRAFMLVISPYARDDELMFQRLRSLGYRALFVSPDSFDFARRTIEASAEGPGKELADLALRTSVLERKIGLERIARLGFPVIDWRVGRELEPILERALARCATARDR